MPRYSNIAIYVAIFPNSGYLYAKFALSLSVRKGNRIEHKFVKALSPALQKLHNLEVTSGF